MEDNPADADLATEALGTDRPDLQLAVVPDGVEALDYLRHRGAWKATKRPDLVFLDLNLPRKDGRQVLAEIKGDEGLRRIPVVVLTSSAAAADIAQSYDLGANCYVLKPVDFGGFQTMVAAVERFWFEVARLPPNDGSSARAGA